MARHETMIRQYEQKKRVLDGFETEFTICFTAYSFNNIGCVDSNLSGAEYYIDFNFYINKTWQVPRQCGNIGSIVYNNAILWYEWNAELQFCMIHCVT